VIKSNVVLNTIFEEDMDYKQFAQIMQSNSVYYWNKYSLFGELVDNNQDCIEERIFLIKFMKIKFYRYLGIRSCLRDL